MNGESLSKKEKMRCVYLSEKKRNKEIYALLPYYEDALILGDSVAESIMDYRLLRKKNVIAQRGRCVDMIDDDIRRAIHMAPKTIIMEYGKNDLLHFRGDLACFIAYYQRQLHILKKQLPDTKIFVNSLIPMGSNHLKRIGGMDIFRQCNALLQELCERENIGFIDNTHLISWEDAQFEFDGIHPKYPFYPVWLRHMAEVTGLLQPQA